MQSGRPAGADVLSQRQRTWWRQGQGPKQGPGLGSRRPGLGPIHRRWPRKGPVYRRRPWPGWRQRRRPRGPGPRTQQRAPTGPGPQLVRALPFANLEEHALTWRALLVVSRGKSLETPLCDCTHEHMTSHHSSLGTCTHHSHSPSKPAPSHYQAPAIFTQQLE